MFWHFWGIGHLYLTETTLHSSLLCRESTYSFSHYSTYPFCFEIFWTIFLIRRIQSRRSRGVKCWEPLSATSIQTVNWMSTWISAGMFDKVEFPLFFSPTFSPLSLSSTFIFKKWNNSNVKIIIIGRYNGKKGRYLNRKSAEFRLPAWKHLTSMQIPSIYLFI